MNGVYIMHTMKHIIMRPKLGGPVYHNNIVGTLRIHLCPSHIGYVLRLPGAVSPDVLLFVCIPPDYKWVTSSSNLPFLLDPSSIAKMQS